MKLRYLAAVSALSFTCAAHAQSSVTLFGIVDEGVVYVNSQRTGGANSGGGSSWLLNSGSVSTTRWGLRGNEDLGGGLGAVFWLENGFNASTGKFNNGGDLFGRQAYVGLTDRQYGALTLGRQYDFLVDYLAPLSAVGAGFGGNFADHPYDNDNLANDLRLNNSIKFSSVAFDGLRVGAMYGFSNDAGEFANNRAYSIGTSYAYGTFSVGAAFLQIDRAAGAANANAAGATSTADTNVLTTGGRQQIYGVGAKYMFGNSQVGIVWTHSSTNDVTGIWQGGSIASLTGSNIKFDNFEVNSRYFFTPEFSLGASYTYTMGQFDAASGTLKPKWNQVMGQADYQLSKRTDLYLEGVYQHVSGGGNNPAFDAGVFSLTPASGNEQVVVAAGLRHRF
ncbi:porin [Paraburkholderia acidipaludis]|uniref:porin n=1 Tax=Paraburkholderia acidipaludis TaxID=660537 RepID=UPI0005BE544D|nr:porin [Paraburkholderia acidipaludis]